MRRWLVGIAGIALAAAAHASSLGEQGTRLLLTRAGFAPSAEEVAQYSGLTQAQAVDRLLAQARKTAIAPPPAWVDDALVTPRELRQMSDEQRRAYRQQQIGWSLELRGWWLREMVASSSPLTERMTLFWHDHFVSAQPKVRAAQLMYRQNALLRRHALGSFADLLHAVARDPAMQIYLDTVINRKGEPNENFAREVMELFTLGQGHYTETDVKEAARAFTGWSVDPRTGRFLVRPALHDDGEKTVLGRTGNLDGDQVLDILLAQPQTAEFVTRKLWREFVSPQPDEARVRAVAAQFRASGYRIDAALRALLLQPEVVQRDQDDALVKSPVELIVGLARQTGADIGDGVGAAIASAAMGQNLFAAPNVRGWPGGEAWINTQTLLARKQFISRALEAPPPAAMDRAPTLMAPVPEVKAADGPRRRLQALAANAMRIDAAAALKSLGGYQPERAIDAKAAAMLAAQLLVLPPVSAPQPGELALDALRTVLLDPVYQLK